jgi:hypothetical protein
MTWCSLENNGIRLCLVGTHFSGGCLAKRRVINLRNFTENCIQFLHLLLRILSFLLYAALSKTVSFFIKEMWNVLIFCGIKRIVTSMIQFIKIIKIQLLSPD